jgi:hypothetical protein
MQNYLNQNKIWEKVNKKVYEEILAISILEEEDIYSVLNNLLGDGIECYKKEI